MLKERKKRSQSKYVVGNENAPISVRSYQRSFELLLKKLNIPHHGFHALRHTFATRAIECGTDVKSLSEMLGHKNPTITLNRYVHSFMEHKRDFVNRMGKMLWFLFIYLSNRWTSLKAIISHRGFLVKMLWYIFLEKKCFFLYWNLDERKRRNLFIYSTDRWTNFRTKNHLWNWQWRSRHVFQHLAKQPGWTYLVMFNTRSE